MSVSTHVLDTARGRPATGLAVTPSHRTLDGNWSVLGRAISDADGRVRELAKGALDSGVYRFEFATGTYFEESGTRAFYPEVSVVFNLSDSGGHLHVPQLLSPFGYATYRET